MKNKLLVVIAVLMGLVWIVLLMLLFSGGGITALGIGGRTVVWLGPNPGVDVGDVGVTDIATGTVQVTGVSNVGVSDITTGTISVDDGSNSLTVDGSVTADSELPAAAALAEGVANPTVPMVGAAGMIFNDTTWDRDYGNWDTVPYASAMRTVGTWVDMTNYNAKGAYLTLNVTGIADTPSIVLEAWIYDSSSGQYETILVGTAVTTISRSSYLIYPGAGVAANAIDVVSAYPLPRRWAVAVVHDDADPITYSVGCAYIQ